MQLAICAATFRRPEMLGELLSGIEQLELAEFGNTRVVVIIVDNDASSSGRQTVEQFQPRYRFPLRYVVEPKRGIAHARNRAIAEALASGADLVAIIDDDEVPRPAWIAHLLRTRATYGADVVYGPVMPRFLEGSPTWIIHGKFFSRPAAATGSLLPTAATHNVLLSRKALTMWSPPFDPQFGLAGVDDTHFFWRLRLAGVEVVSAAEAIVDETVPAARMSLRFLFRRAYNAGAGFVACQRALDDRRGWRTRRLMVGGARVVGGA